jgi:hypothetical protein
MQPETTGAIDEEIVCSLKPCGCGDVGQFRVAEEAADDVRQPLQSA